MQPLVIQLWCHFIKPQKFFAVNVRLVAQLSSWLLQFTFNENVCLSPHGFKASSIKDTGKMKSGFIPSRQAGSCQEEEGYGPVCMQRSAVAC